MKFFPFQRTEAPLSAAFSTYTDWGILSLQSKARESRTQGQSRNLGTPGECHMQSRNEIVHTVKKTNQEPFHFFL